MIHLASRFITAGKPHNLGWNACNSVRLAGTSCSTTLPAEATRAQAPISIFPRTVAPAPKSTPRPTLGCRSRLRLSGSTEGHTMKQRAIITDRGSFANDDVMCYDRIMMPRPMRAAG